MDTVWEQAVLQQVVETEAEVANHELVDDAAGLEPIDEEERSEPATVCGRCMVSAFLCASKSELRQVRRESLRPTYEAAGPGTQTTSARSVVVADWPGHVRIMTRTKTA